jgi:hypothetical protein
MDKNQQKKIYDKMKTKHKKRENEFLISFIYQLLRDEIAPGVIEKIICNMENASIMEKEIQYSNKYLEGYAFNISQRLLGKKAE